MRKATKIFKSWLSGAPGAHPLPASRIVLKESSLRIRIRLRLFGQTGAQMG